jgi:hypothetical protein
MNSMKMSRVGLMVAVTVAATACGDALTSRVDIAARVGTYELPVDQLAELIAKGKGLPLRREVAEGIAVLWVDYTIFADRILAGDSLTDSALVAAAMWAEIQQELADRYHQQLVGDQVHLDSAAVDSIYAAGEYRLIKQILFKVDPNASPAARGAKQQLAQETYFKLKTGVTPWGAAAAAMNEDAGAQDKEGSLGVIARGEMVAPFENVAYALSPNEISPVTQTTYGYHILWRPPLDSVREAFREGVEDRRERKFDDEFLAGLPSRWDIKVRSGVGPAVREMGQDPMRAKESGKVLGTYKGGRFRVSDLARWIQAMPQNVRQQMANASDSQVTQMVASLMRNEALVREAKEHGATISPSVQADLAEQLRRQLALVSALLGFPTDTLPMLRALPPEARHDSVRVHVYEYLSAVASNSRRLQAVPPFLADTLRSMAKWEVVPAGIEQVLTRARDLRLALDSLPASRGAPAPPPAVPPATPAPRTPPR